MILAKLEERKRYESLHPLMKTLFDYIESHDLSNVEPGRIHIKGDDLFINVDEAEMKDKEEQCLEVHRRYIDVQIPVSCGETVGWRPLSTIKEKSEAPFNEEKDFALYKVPAATYLDVHPGEFYVMFPEDAHGPIIGKGKIRKLIGKLKI